MLRAFGAPVYTPFSPRLRAGVATDCVAFRYFWRSVVDDDVHCCLPVDAACWLPVDATCWLPVDAACCLPVDAACWLPVDATCWLPVDATCWLKVVAKLVLTLSGEGVAESGVLTSFFATPSFVFTGERTRVGILTSICNVTKRAWWTGPAVSSA